jgi:hypothetical protein
VSLPAAAAKEMGSAVIIGKSMAMQSKSESALLKIDFFISGPPFSDFFVRLRADYSL